MQMKGGREWTCPFLNVHRPAFLWIYGKLTLIQENVLLTLVWQIKDFSRHNFNKANLHTRKNTTWSNFAALLILKCFVFCGKAEYTERPILWVAKYFWLRNSSQFEIWTDAKWKLYQERRNRYQAHETYNNSQVFLGKSSVIIDSLFIKITHQESQVHC